MTDIVLIFVKLIVLSPHFLGKLFFLFCFLVRITLIYQNQIFILMCSGKFISRVAFSISKITFVRLMSPQAGLSCCYLWGRLKWTKIKWLTSFQACGCPFRFGSPLSCFRETVLNGRITGSRYVFYHGGGFTLSNKAHLFSEYILWHPRGETLRLAQWGLSRPGCVDPSTGCERQRNCSPCKAMWAESVSGKLAEQIIHGLRERTKEQTNL